MTTIPGPRTRITNDSSTSEWSRKRIKPPGGVWGAYTNYVNTVTSKNLDVMSDIVTPNFKERIASGQIINNPMTKTVHTRSGGGGTYIQTYLGEVVEVTGPGSLTQTYLTILGSAAIGSPVDGNVVIARAKQLAIANIDKAPYQFLEDQLEFQKTLDFLKNPFSDAADLAENFQYKRRTNLRHGMSLLNATSKAWLTYRYALRPIVISISNIWRSYEDGVIARATGLPELGSFSSTRRTARGYDTLTRTYAGNVSNGTATNGNTFYRELDTSFSCRAGIIYEVSNPISSFSEKHGLRLKDLPANLYNIMPYSWVLNRFIDIESAINGMMNLADPKVNILTGWTVTDEHRRSLDRFIERHLTNYTFSVSADNLTENYDQKVRNPWAPSFNDTLPHFTPMRALKDAAFITDLASLVVKRLTKI